MQLQAQLHLKFKCHSNVMFRLLKAIDMCPHLSFVRFKGHVSNFPILADLGGMSRTCNSTSLPAWTHTTSSEQTKLWWTKRHLTLWINSTGAVRQELDDTDHRNDAVLGGSKQRLKNMMFVWKVLRFGSNQLFIVMPPQALSRTFHQFSTHPLREQNWTELGSGYLVC